AQMIAQTTTDSLQRVTDLLSADRTLDEGRAYDALIKGINVDAVDANSRPGPAVNLQSVITGFRVGDRSALLCGDMQFADPQVADPAIGDEVQKLRRIVQRHARFDVVKVAHHGSDNAFSQDILAELKGTPRFGISGGARSVAHPSARVLGLLSGAQPKPTWARTDLNGQSTFRISRYGGEVTVSHG